MPAEIEEIVIPREKAVFRMDARGRWHNEHGLFEHPKIIAYFNANIRRDEGGYYLSQEINGHLEKVYFPYADTALFAVDLLGPENADLLLNTGLRVPLAADRLAMRGDVLYQLMGDDDRHGDRIRFSERCLLKLADRIVETDGGYCFDGPGGRHPILELSEGDA